MSFKRWINGWIARWNDSGPSPGYLEVGNNGREVIINHPKLKVDEQGCGHINFSPGEARSLASLLLKHANELDPDERGQPASFAIFKKSTVRARNETLVIEEFPVQSGLFRPGDRVKVTVEKL